MRRLPILDQSVCALQEMQALLAWLETQLAAGAHVLIHCVGGIGRSGLVAACYLKTRNLDTASAIEEVRRVRSPRAVASAAQEAFIRDFCLTDWAGSE